MCTSPHAVHLVHAGCCNTRAPARCSLQGVAARPGCCCGLPARLPLPVRLTRSRPYGLRGGAGMLCIARAPAPSRRAPGRWAWGRVSMFTISGNSCTTYRAAFSSYTYLTERIEYKSLIPVTNPLANRFTTRRQIVRFSPLPGARGGAGRMVVERINKTELRTAVCGELEGQKRGGADAPRLGSRI